MPPDAESLVQTGTGGAARTVSRGIMRGLELSQFVPGQRLVETDLAQHFRVGRNAAREAIQWLAAHGVIDVSRHRSPAIRLLTEAETMEMLDAAAAIVGLAARTAALRYRPEEHRALLGAALGEVEGARDGAELGAFSRARRHFYGALLTIGGNRELQRLFRVVGLHILYAQYRSADLARQGAADFRTLAVEVAARDANRAEAAGRAHIETVRRLVLR